MTAEYHLQLCFQGFQAPTLMQNCAERHGSGRGGLWWSWPTTCYKALDSMFWAPTHCPRNFGRPTWSQQQEPIPSVNFNVPPLPRTCLDSEQST